jgi:isopenicillin N synthase-like dioxygenase
MHVATVDYGSPDAPTRFARSLEQTGFAVVTNHPLPVRLMRQVEDEWLAFFATGAKYEYVHLDGAQDGFFPYDPGDGVAVRDRKEFFHVRPGGSYPGEVSDAALRYFHAASALGATLLDWVELRTPAEVIERLSMPLSAMLEGSRGTVLRIQHYFPPAADEPAGGLRALAHEDLNLLTVLPAPTGPGLQVCDRAGNWHDVPVDDAAVVVNGGAMLSHATGGLYPATPHRVLRPERGEHASKSRMSLPLFLHPAPDVRLSERHTAETFLEERLRALRERGWAVAPGGRGS